MMLLRARTLAMGYSGARPEVAETIVALLNAGLTPVVPEHGSLGASGDLAPAGALRAGADRRGRGARPRRRRGPAAEALARGRDRAADAAGQGGPGADQRHRRDARHARRSRSTTCARLLRVADVTAAMSVEALLGTDRAFADGPDRAAAAAGPGGERRQPAPAARRLGDRRSPSRGRPPGPGRLLAALRAAGERRRPRRARARASGRRRRARRRDRQPDDPSRRPGRVVRQLPRRAARASPATSSRSPPPRSARSPSGAPTACSTRRAPTGCRRSSPTTRASTPG